jgi:hypothetical protein
MPMNSQFEITAGSVAGTRHVAAGRNNQDALKVVSTSSATVAVVCDGCGSASRSEVGAWLGAELIASAIARRCDGRRRFELAVLTQVENEVLNTVRALGATFGDDAARVVSEGFLFTVIGAVVLADETVVFAAGDGVFAINGEVVAIGPFAGNAPPYLGLALLEKQPTPGRGLKILRRVPTAEVESLVVGSDGVGELVDGDRIVSDMPSFSDLWADDAFFSNPDALRRRLAKLNQPRRDIDWERRRVRKTAAVLDDDTSLVVIRRRREVRIEEPAA